MSAGSDGREALPRPPGRSVAEGRISKGAQRLLKQAAFTGTLPEPGFYYRDLDEWRDVVTSVIGYAADAMASAPGVPDALRAAEADHLRAACACWRVPGTGRQLKLEPLSIDNAAQAEALRPYLRRRGRTYAALVDAMPQEALAAALGAPIVLSKGKGAPNFVPGSDVASGAILTRLTFEAFEREGPDGVHALAERLRPGGIGLARVLWRRIQGLSGKQVTEYLPDSSGWLTVPRLARLPKVRDVKASPMLVNALLAPMSSVLKWAQRRGQHSHDGSVQYADALVKAFNGNALAVDFSTFDDTVSLQTRKAWREEVMEPAGDALIRAARKFLNSKGVARIELIVRAGIWADSWSDTGEMLRPPRHYGEVGVMLDQTGGISSGEYDTSLKGNDIAGSVGEYVAATVDPSLVHINQSDDQLFIGSHKGDSIVSAIDSLGLKATLPEDVAYLMRSLPGGFMFVGRALAGVINSEVQTEPKTWAHATASMALRRSALVGHPAFHIYDEALAKHENTAAIQRFSHLPALDAARLVAYAGSGGRALADRPGEEYALLNGYTAEEAEDVAQLIDAVAARSALSISSILDWPWHDFDRVAADMQRRYIS